MRRKHPCFKLLKDVAKPEPMTDAQHELFGYTIYESVLEGAGKKIECLAGVELPFFHAWPDDAPEGFDEENDERIIQVSFRETYWDQPVEGAFQIGEDTFKGIAQDRHEDIKTFVHAFLKAFRPGYMQATLCYELHLLDSEWFEDQRHIDKTNAYDIFHGFGTSSWVVNDVRIKALSPELFRADIVFVDADFDLTVRERLSKGKGIEPDSLVLPVSLNWDQFIASIQARTELMKFLTRIHDDFLVRKNDLEGFYSKEAKCLMDALEEEIWDEDF